MKETSKRSISYPGATLPEQVFEGEVLTDCMQCGQKIGIRKWDKWNGLIVRCPHCGGLHGKSWDFRLVAMASFFFNAFSFFFTMRFKSALRLFAVFAIWDIAGYLMLNRLSLYPNVDLVWAAVAGIGPVAVNAFVMVSHNAELDRQTGSKAASL